METQIKMKGFQKLALERIYRLFELAEKNPEYASRYLEIAQTMGMKTKVKIPKELKKKYCRKCLSIEVEEKEEGAFLVITCKKCGAQRKYSNDKK